jgi:hypothetical protein
MRQLILLVVIILKSGCSTLPLPQLTREESLAATTRTYDIPKETVIAAAEQVLRLADDNDFKLVHNPDGFIASRSWTESMLLYIGTGTDHWVIRVDEEESKSRISIAIETRSSTTLPEDSSPPFGRATYDLFFQRLDYLLGYSSAWTDCKTANAELKAKKTWGNNEALCNLSYIKDEKPTAPLVNVK